MPSPPNAELPESVQWYRRLPDAPPPAQAELPVRKQLYSDPNLGFLTVHVYPDDVNSPEIPRADREMDLARAVGKPLIIEEIGFMRADRAAKIRAAMDKWFQQGAKGLMQWGFVALGHNNGDGDERHGMDNFSTGHPKDFKALAQVFTERAQALAS